MILVNAPAAVALAIPKPGYPGRTLTIKDIAGNADTYNTTVTPATGAIDGQASLVINSNYAAYDLLDTGSVWVITKRYAGTTPLLLTVAPFNITFNARSDSSTSLTNMPSAEQLFPLGNKHAIIKQDLTGYTQARLVANIVAGTASVNTPKLKAKFKTTLTYTTDVSTDFSELGTGGSEIAISFTTAGVIVSSWVNLTDLAKTNVYLAMAHIGGDAATTPAMGSVLLQVK